MTKKHCPLGEDCDLTIAWMMGAEDARDRAKARIAALEAKLAKNEALMQAGFAEYERRLAEAEQTGYANAMEAERKLHEVRIEALQQDRDEALNQLDSARHTVDVLVKRLTDRMTKLAKAVEALEGCMIGGNHLVTWLPENHLPADTDPLAALVRHGAGVSHDIWCCWRSIMQARTTLAELKGDKL
jgi:hypothetical protein